MESQLAQNFSYVKKEALEVAKLELDNEENVSLAEKWKALGLILESHNFDKSKIAKKVRQLIEEQRFKLLVKRGLDEVQAKNNSKFKSGYYYTVMSSESYTDQTFARNLVTSKELESSSDSRIKTVASDLPFADLRNMHISLCYDLINELEFTITELYKKDDADWKSFFESEEMSGEFFNMIKDMIYDEKEEWKRIRDSRQILLPKMLMPALAFKTLVLNKNFCNMYFAKIKKATTITTKKLSQFLKDTGTVSDLLHYTKTDAWLWNFIDIPCPLCSEKHLKVKMYENGLWDFVCKNWTAHHEEKHFPPELLGNTFAELEKNMSKSSEKYLATKGISTPKE